MVGYILRLVLCVGLLIVIVGCGFFEEIFDEDIFGNEILIKREVLW